MLRLVIFFTALCYIPLLVADSTHPVNRKASMVESAKDRARLKVFKLINERLSHMKSVAVYKANHHLQVEDLSREKVVLSKALDKAVKKKLNADSIASFFQLQMDLSKIIQYRFRADYLLIKNKIESININNTRIALLNLGDEIIDSIAIYLHQYGRFQPQEKAEFIKAVKNPLLSESEVSLLFDSLILIRLEGHGP